MKKLFTRSLSAVLACALLAGCSSTAQTSSSETSGAASDTSSAASGDTASEGGSASGDPVTLRFAWWGDDRTAATMEVIDQFEALYPNVTIEAEYGGSDGYNDKLATQLASGTAADIVQVDPETFPTYVSGGDYFVNFFDYDFDFSNFDESYISQRVNGRFDDKQLGIPTGIAGAALLVNQDLADEIGIDLSQELTWDDLFELGKKVREYDDSMYLLCMNKDYMTNCVVYNYLKQLTGTTIFDDTNRTLSLTQEQLQECFDYVDRLYKEEVVAPASYSAAYSGDNLQSDPNWIDGKYVATFTYISTMEVMMAANENVNYSVGSLPILENAKSDAWFANCPQVMAVTKTSSSPETAVAFLDYFFNDDTAISTLACTRSVPPTEKAREICTNDGTLNELVMQAANLVSGMDGIPNDTIASSQEGKQIVIDSVEEVGYGATSPADAAANAIGLLQGLV